ncbi:hypothetical protein F2Q65_09345 [Thiohalocapsa marina]|uniref:PIN domain-containing protein n=1 Tax=Thiohalocapsa marina TaxID=424902 RepID=A0A5M8FLC4_9GAMM|nr:hypothetical protein [Thiohalocapsa marina]KAA6185294.1 hypothetical protein F2Q65_09345 [Thiohalocapsa marina]
MKVLIESDVILGCHSIDQAQRNACRQVLQQIADATESIGCLCANSVTVLAEHLPHSIDSNQVRAALSRACTTLQLLPADQALIRAALGRMQATPSLSLEQALLLETAERHAIDHLIALDTEALATSAVPVTTPVQWLSQPAHLTQAA